MQGCYNKFRYFLRKNLNLVVLAIVGVGAAQLAAVGLTFRIYKVG